MKLRGLSLFSIAIAFATLLASCAPAGQPPAPTQAPAPKQAAPAATAAPAKPAEAKPAESKPAAKAPEPAKPAAPGGKLTIAYGAIPTTADPAFDTNALSMDAYDTVFDKLVLFQDGKLQPAVAESWKSVSNTEWEFKLRRDVKFTNGEPLNAAAAAFSIQRIVDSNVNSPWRSQMGPIAKAEATDDVTLKVTTSEPVATLPQNLLVAYIVPPKYYQEVGKDQFAKAPIGSGPFKFREIDPLTHFTVTANPESWRWQGKQPSLDEITWKKLPEDATRTAAFQAGEVDVAADLPYEFEPQLKGGGATVISQPIAQTFVFNMRSIWDTPFKHKAVRQALNYAVDKDSIIKNIFRGNATLSNGQIIGSDAFGYNPNLKPYPYDPAKAKELLASAGYPDGFEATFHVSQGRYPKDKEVAEIVTAQLGQIGVKAKMEVLENAVFSKMSQDATIGPLLTFGWQYMPAMDIAQPIPHLTCPASRKFFCDEQLDAATKAMFNAMDPAERQQKAIALSEVLYDTAPAIFLWQFHSLYAVHPHVKGYVPLTSRNADLTKVTTEKR